MTHAASMCPIFVGAAWCVAHFLLYVLIRFRLGTEFRIFAFHAVSFVAYTVALGTWYYGGGSAVVVAGVVAVHSIYSLSFLELWSLTQGGYSLSILREIAAQRNVSVEWIIQECTKIGDEKKSLRLATMIKSGLIHLGQDQTLSLSIIGTSLAVGVQVLRALGNWDRPG